MGLKFYEDSCISVGSVIKNDEFELFIFVDQGYVRVLDLLTGVAFVPKSKLVGKHPTESNLREIIKDFNEEDWECIL